jgi:hypothetical protein
MNVLHKQGTLCITLDWIKEHFHKYNNNVPHQDRHSPSAPLALPQDTHSRETPHHIPVSFVTFLRTSFRRYIQR